MKWKIELYEKENGECPTLDFILSQSPKEQAKIEREINLLEEFGMNLTFPHTRKLEGAEYRGLWEIRVKLATNAFRIFYFLYVDNVFVLLCGIKKKSDKTPHGELDKAKHFMTDYIRRKQK